jgi:hypothetical protein
MARPAMADREVLYTLQIASTVIHYDSIIG